MNFIAGFFPLFGGGFIATMLFLYELTSKPKQMKRKRKTRIKPPKLRHETDEIIQRKKYRNYHRKYYIKQYDICYTIKH